MSDEIEREILQVLHRRYDGGNRYVKTWYVAEAVDDEISTRRMGQILGELENQGYLEVWSSGSSSKCWRMTELVKQEVVDA